jgi:hypothetical protein
MVNLKSYIILNTRIILNKVEGYPTKRLTDKRLTDNYISTYKRPK